MNYKFRFVFPLLMQFFFYEMLFSQTQPCQSLATEFLDAVEKNAYMSSTIDWGTERPLFLKETMDIQSIKELKPYFRSFLKKLKDSHSSISYMESEEENELDVLARYANVTYEEAGYPALNFKSEFLEEKYAYINIPGVVLEQKKYIQTIGRQLKELDDKNPKAWIFDLTENDGGSITPMLWQMFNLIDEDSIYSFVNSIGKEERQNKKMWDAEGDAEDQRLLDIFNLRIEELEPVKLNNINIPIVILTSKKMASSGEFFVAAFKGQNNVTVLGQVTNRLTSGNSEYPLGKDYLLNLTTDVLKDRNGKIYKIGEGISPDVTLEPDVYNEIDKDHPSKENIYIEEALQLLRSL